ncbi:hypothetical protein EIP91_005235 [Steccherinum ochraceum]|uniref:Uncharacterized protein n=1 Tax=Steccherinum ochraceum TaxID=92696 RepID=A0A4R0RMM7_9APHY|nr:hypothetical protein EIP91_005235 [Steccherinum ochraceum]
MSTRRESSQEVDLPLVRALDAFLLYQTPFPGVVNNNLFVYINADAVHGQLPSLLIDHQTLWGTSPDSALIIHVWLHHRGSGRFDTRVARMRAGPPSERPGSVRHCVTPQQIDEEAAEVNRRLGDDEVNHCTLFIDLKAVTGRYRFYNTDTFLLTKRPTVVRLIAVTTVGSSWRIVSNDENEESSDDGMDAESVEA